MSISQNFPDLTPSLNLNFAGSKKLDSRITFTRGSTGTYTDDNGIIRTAGINQPRFDHSYDGTSVESLGLLIEESRTNLLTYSEDTSNYNFIENATVSTNSSVAPDGTTTADTLTSSINGGSNTCFVQKSATVPNDSAKYIFSCFLKPGTSPLTTLNLQFYGGTYVQSVLTITWSTLSFSYTGGEMGTVTPYPNGWYRISLSLSNNSSGNVSCAPRIYVRDQGSSNVSGHTVQIWGWQLEAGSFATSYIPTTTSSVTRSADNASITGTNFSSWYNSTEGSVLCSGRVLKVNPPSLGQIFWAIGDSATFNESVYLVNDPGQTYIGVNMIDGGSNVFATSGSTITNNSFNKTAVTFKLNDSAVSFNGSSPTTDTSCTLPNVNTLVIGNASWGTSNPLNGTIAQLSYYPKRLTNTQLQNLTR